MRNVNPYVRPSTNSVIWVHSRPIWSVFGSDRAVFGPDWVYPRPIWSVFGIFGLIRPICGQFLEYLG